MDERFYELLVTHAEGLDNHNFLPVFSSIYVDI